MPDLRDYLTKSSPTISPGKDIFQYIGGIGSPGSQVVVVGSTVDTSDIKLEYTVGELSAYVDAARLALSDETAYYDNIISTLEDQLESLTIKERHA